MADKPLVARRRRNSWLMGDSHRQSQEYAATIERRSDPLPSKPAKRPEQLFDEIEIEEDER